MSTRTRSLHELAGLIVRRRWLILIPFALGVALAPYLARYAPARYRSDALIVVLPQQVPDEYVKPTVNQSLDQRLPSITDQILSRSRLERIIQELDLYKAERARSVMEDVVEKMRQDVTTSADGKNIDSFRVSYVSDNPETARKVTERLVSLYIDQNSKDRETQADHTSEFLDSAARRCEAASDRPGKEARGLSQEPRRRDAFADGGQSASDSERQPAIAVIERVDQPRSGAPLAHRAPDRRRAAGSRCTAGSGDRHLGVSSGIGSPCAA